MKKYLFLLILTIAVYAQAQFTGSLQTITIDGVASNVAGNFFVGNGYWGDVLIVTNSGSLVDTSGYVGNLAADSNNAAVVTGAGSAWTNSGSLYVGNYGSGNQLTIANGGNVFGNDAVHIGSNVGANTNTVRVTGAGSVLSNRLTLYVGWAGMGNQLTIANNGTVYSAGGIIGNSATANNNAVLVTGTGSVWRTTGWLGINNAGGSGTTGNGLILSTGGVAVVSGAGTIKIYAGGYISNYVATVAGGLDMSAGNTFVIDSGGKMSIVFAGYPKQDGPYWGLRWAGNHTNDLTTLASSGKLIITATVPFLRSSIYYDATNTYIIAERTYPIMFTGGRVDFMGN